MIFNRDIYKEGKKSFRDFLYFLVAIYLIFCLVTIFFLKTQVISRIINLIKTIEKISHSQDISARITQCMANDELKDLSSSINLMLNSLESVEKQKVQLQKQVNQSMKFAALGEMSSGIAHEINNPLTVIMGYADLLKKNKDKHSEKELKEIIQAIIDSSSKIRIVIEHLRKIADRPTGKDRTLFNVNVPIEESMILLRKSMEFEQVSVIHKLEDNLPNIWGNQDEFERVFHVLLQNSKDAFLESNAKNKIVTIASKIGDGGVVVTYSDNAGGVPEDIENSIFDPFFSTKEAGKGSGLGLSIVYSTINKYNGTIQFINDVPRGSTFEIFIPAGPKTV